MKVKFRDDRHQGNEGGILMKNWIDRKDTFDVLDVRKGKGNFLPGILNKARSIETGKGLCVVQTFEPKPLYSAMEELGFDHYTVKADEAEYRTYFFREREGQSSYKKTGDLPLKPTAIVNFKQVDNTLGEITVNFWELIWGKKEPAIDLKIKLLLSLTNAVGAGRMRQATRELVKAYSIGLTVPEMDELFSLLAWNGGIGTFSSEIGPSPLYGAYQMIKTMEEQGKERDEIVQDLMGSYGETNPATGVIAGKPKKEA